jgi:orotidine-5'-phosphate decarboxylase
VGAVVGATKAHDARALRERMPDQVFLIPGYGAQGGTAEDIRGMLRAKRAGAADAGVLVTASRSIIYAFERDATDWAEQVRGAAVTLRSEIAAIVRL